MELVYEIWLITAKEGKYFVEIEKALKKEQLQA